MEVRPVTFWMVLAAVTIVGAGIFGNPWLTTPREMADALLVLEVITCTFWLGFEFYRASRHANPDEDLRETRGFPSMLAVLALLTVFSLWLYLYSLRWQSPQLRGDDFHYIALAGDWETTRRSLFAPYNEHLVVPTRLLTYFLVAAFNDCLPFAAAISVIPLFFLTIIQLYFLGQRSFRSEFAALVAVTAFAITGVYHEIIFWYSATQWLFAFNLLLFSLNLTERYGGRPTWEKLGAMFVLAAAGPFSFSIGLFVGPITACWMAIRSTSGKWANRWVCLIPVVGTVVGVAMVAPILIQWMQSDVYREAGGRAASHFSVKEGIVYCARLVVDQLLLKNLGLRETFRTPWAHPILFPIFTVGLVALLRARAAAWKLLPAVMIVVIGYGLTIPLRTWVQYSSLLLWTRYNMVPQLGLAVLAAGTVVHLYPVTSCGKSGRLTFKQTLLILLLATALTLIHKRAITVGY